MKILHILADGDYDACSFEAEDKGQKVSDLIVKVEAGEILTYKSQDGDVEHFDLDARVVEVGEIDKRFLDFVRDDVQDYDDSKHTNFYLENEEVIE